jgi:transposase
MPCERKRSWEKQYKSKWTAKSDITLKKIVTDNPVFYLDEMKRSLKAILSISFSTSQISVRLRKLGFSRKVVYEKATQQIATDKSNFIDALNFHLKSPEMAIFIDESNKDRKAARRKFGWSKIGIQVNYRALFNMDIRYTLIGAANCYGFVLDACETVMHKFKEKEEHRPVDSNRFVEYVREKLVPVLGRYDRQEPNSVVIMDNCSIHLDPAVSQLITAAGAIIIYSAPYCPEVIPIEYMFHQWKAYLKRYHVDFNVNWYRVHTLALISITKQQALNYFKKPTLVDLVQFHPLLVDDVQQEIEQALYFIAQIFE